MRYLPHLYVYTDATGRALCCECAARLTEPEVIGADVIGDRRPTCDGCRVAMRPD